MLAICLAGAAHANVRSFLTLSRDGSLIAAGATAGPHKHKIHLYDGKSLHYLRSFPADYIKQLQLSADGRVLGYRGHLSLIFLRTDTGEELEKHRTSYHLTFSGDGQWCLARLGSTQRRYSLISLSDGETEHDIKLPKEIVNVKGFGFHADRCHFILLGESLNLKTRQRSGQLIRGLLTDGSISSMTVTSAGGPKHNEGGILTLLDGFLVESGRGTLLLKDDGSVTNLGTSEGMGKSGTSNGMVLLGKPKYFSNKSGVEMGIASRVKEVETALSTKNLAFVEVPYDRLKPERSLERIAGMARHGATVIFSNPYGTIFRVNAAHQLDGMGMPPENLKLLSPGAAKPKAQTPAGNKPATENAPLPNGLAEIAIRANKKVSVEVLAPGAPRMSGKVHGKIESARVSPGVGHEEDLSTVRRCGPLLERLP